MIDELKKHISIITSILVVVGIFIYLSTIKSTIKSNIDFMINKYDKKIDSLNVLIKEHQINKNILYSHLDSLANKKTLIVNKFYNDIKVYENINNSDSIISIIHEQFKILGSPKFD